MMKVIWYGYEITDGASATNCTRTVGWKVLTGSAGSTIGPGKPLVIKNQWTSSTGGPRAIKWSQFKLNGLVLVDNGGPITLSFPSSNGFDCFNVGDQVQGIPGTAEFTAYHLKKNLEDNNGASFTNVAELLALTPGTPYGAMSVQTITTTMGDNDYCSDLDSKYNVTGFVYHLDKPRAHMKLGLSACSGGSSVMWRLYMTNDSNQLWGNATMIEKDGLTLDTDPVIDSGDTPYQYFLLFDYQSAPNVLENGIQNYGLNTVLTSTGAKVVAKAPDAVPPTITVDSGSWKGDDNGSITGDPNGETKVSKEIPYDTTLTLADDTDLTEINTAKGTAEMTDGGTQASGAFTHSPYKLTTSQITDIDYTDPSTVVLTFADPCPDLQYFQIGDSVQGPSENIKGQRIGPGNPVKLLWRRPARTGKGGTFANASLYALKINGIELVDTLGGPLSSNGAIKVYTFDNADETDPGGPSTLTSTATNEDALKAFNDSGLTKSGYVASSNSYIIWEPQTNFIIDTMEIAIVDGDTTYDYQYILEFNDGSIFQNEIPPENLSWSEFIPDPSYIREDPIVVIEEPDVVNRKLTVDGGEWRIGNGAETPAGYTVRKSSDTTDPPDLTWGTIGNTGQETVLFTAASKYPTDTAQYGIHTTWCNDSPVLAP